MPGLVVDQDKTRKLDKMQIVLKKPECGLSG